MGYLKFISYLYLAAAAVFLYDGIMRLNAGEDAILSFAFVAVAIFMFFFRRKYAKKFTDKTKED